MKAIDITKPDITAQEVFDVAVSGVIAQGCRSADDYGACFYRDSRGHACAVGQLLTDEEAMAADALEDTGVYDINAAGLLPQRLVPHAHLLDSLQTAHDCATNPFGFVGDFISAARIVAENHDLDPSIIDTCIGGAR